MVEKLAPYYTLRYIVYINLLTPDDMTTSTLSNRCSARLNDFDVCEQCLEHSAPIEDQMVTASTCTHCGVTENVKKMRLYADGKTLLCKPYEERLSEAAPDLLACCKAIADFGKGNTPQYIAESIAKALPIEEEIDRRITEGLCPDCGSELREASGENAVADPSDNYGVSYQNSTWRECVQCDYSEEL